MNEAPVLLMIAGPNGSGKTTLTKQLMEQGVDLGSYINPDDIAATLAGPYEERVRQAQRKAEELRQDCLARHVSFSFETVMSHPSKIDVLKQARSLGYFNVLYFVGTESPQLNTARVDQRVALGGHSVPVERIYARYERAMKLLPEAIAQCDRSVLFDNSYRPAPDERVRLVPFREFRSDGRGRLLFPALSPMRMLAERSKSHRGNLTPRWAAKYLGPKFGYWL